MFKRLSISPSIEIKVKDPSARKLPMSCLIPKKLADIIVTIIRGIGAFSNFKQTLLVNRLNEIDFNAWIGAPLRLLRKRQASHP